MGTAEQPQASTRSTPTQNLEADACTLGIDDKPDINSPDDQTGNCKNLTADAPAQEKPLSTCSPLLHRDDRPVATPTNSTRQCHLGAATPSVPSRGADVAAMWLRLARIALLELTKLPPPHRLLRFPDPKLDCGEQEGNSPQNKSESNKWMNMAFPNEMPGEQVEADGMPLATASRGSDSQISILADPVLAAWKKLLTRVLNVTMAGRGSEPPERLELPTEPESAEECEVSRPRRGHALICLGDLMEESISWIEVDSEDDVNSPKQ